MSALPRGVTLQALRVFGAARFGSVNRGGGELHLTQLAV